MVDNEHILSMLIVATQCYKAYIRVREDLNSPFKNGIFGKIFITLCSKPI